MSKDLNKWMGIGRLGKDPEIRALPNGNAVTNISIACSGDYRDKNTGQKVEVTEWVNIVFFNRLAEIAGEYLKKGSQVYVEGSLRTRKWQSQDGTEKYTTEIVGNELQMLGGRAGTTENAADRGVHQGVSGSPSQQAAPPSAGMDSFDDDILF